MRHSMLATAVALACTLGAPSRLTAQRGADGQAPQRGAGGPQRGLLGRPSPPQPQQKQGVDYFVGSWSYSWTGRESDITAGPRTGSVTFAVAAANPMQLTIAAEGTAEGSGAFKETGTFTWDEAKKSAVIRERLAGGVDVVGTGDWTSPIAIRYESEPIRVKGQTLKLKRLYSIHSVASFSVTEELSTNGGPFVRLGNGTYSKK